MADGKFKIAGSTTGNYYVMKNGKRTYFDANHKPMDENVFLKAENATIDRNNSMRKKEHVDAKSNLVKQYYPGSKTGRYYTVNPKTGQKTYYASNGHPIKESYWLQKEQEAVEAVKNKGKSKGTEKTEKKGFWGKLWDHAKSFGKGVVKSVTSAFTDENGKFSPKQTLKTIGYALAITAIAATAVAAGICTAGFATAVIVGWGVYMGGSTIYYGAKNYANANTYEEKLKATEEMGEGTGVIGQTILFRKGINGQMRNAAAVGRTAKMEALASGSGRYVASLKGAGAGLKSMVPSPKQMLEGTKQTLNSARKGVKTAYDTVRHPVRTTQKTIQSYKVKNQISEAKTPKDFAEIRKDLESNDILSVKQKEKLYKKLDNADIQQSVSGAKTHEDIAAVRKRVNESEVLSAKQKAKYNKQLDKAAESATHEDLAALRKNATETAANPSAKKSEITKAQKEYENGVKRSTDREALENAQNEGLSEFEGMKKADFEAKIQTAKSGTSAENDALFTAIKKSNLEPKVKTKLLKDLKAKGAKQSSTSVAIEKRIVELDKLQETEFNGLINKAEFKKGSWASRQVKRIRGKKGEYETIEARIKAEVKNPEIREQLLTKLKNKKQLLEDINNLKKHPKKDEYEKLIGRAKDEVSLDLIEKKLANDHHIIKSRTTPKERSDLYRKIFAKQHSINPEKYPNIGAKLEEKRLDAELKKANADLAKAKRELNRLESERDAASAEIDANRATSRSNTNEVRNRNGRIEELKGQIEKLESQKAELQTARSEQGENSQRVQELQNEIREIRRGLPEKQAKLKELQEKYTTAEKNVKNLETAQRTAKRKVENNQKALEEVAAKKPKRGWGAIPTMIVATENVAHTADTLQTGVEALMALAAEDAQEEQQVTEDEQVAETQQETGDDVEQIGDAPEDEATATDETTSDTSTDTSNDSSTPVSDSATPVTGTPSNTPVNGGNSSTPKVEDKKAEDKKVEDKTNTPATEEKKEDKPVTAEEPTVDNDDNNNSVNDITIKTYINGRDESGELRDITPAERLILTEQIQNAKNIDDVALIYSEMRSFNKFDGRRNLRRALKQKRKEIEGKHNNYYARMQRVNNDNATLNVTEADRLLAKTNESSTENLSNMSTVKKKFGMFRSPEYLLKSDNADIGVLNQGTPITDSPVINETNLFAPTDALAKENAAAPETTSEANPNAETAPTLVDSPVENPADATSSDSSVAQVKEETTAPQTDMAQADIPDDEVKHKLDIDNGWGDLA